MKAVLLLALLARADDFDDMIRRSVEELRPAVRAAPTIGQWRHPKAYGWKGDEFTGPFGLRLHKSCMKLEGAAPPLAPAKFITELQKMHATLQQCAATRVLPATVGLIYDRAARARVDCDPKACEYADKSVNAIACTDSEEGLIHVKQPAGYAASTFAHELMHFTKHVDNQSWEDHAHQENRLRDEVYFWERHCFDQDTLLQKMRAEFVKRGETHANAYAVCSMPFRHNVRRKLLANEREIKAVCDQYAAYLMMEVNMGRQVRDLTAEAGRVFPKTSASREKLAELRLLPPPDAPYDAGAFTEWTRTMCALVDTRSAADNPSWLLRSCAETLMKRSEDPEVVKTLSAEDAFAVSQYFVTLHARARALSEGPGRYEKALADQGAEGLKAVYAKTWEECGSAELIGDSFCQELLLDQPPMVLLGRLYMHWQPKTLTP